MRLLLVDSHQVVREGLKSFFGQQFGDTVFGDARNTADALKLIREQEWDVAILSLSGSAPEFDKTGISSCFPESHKFGSGCG
jgi:DNA-binding NarL/FixJ family response regulator